MSRYLLEPVRREEIHALLLCLVSVPKEFSPLKDLWLIQPSLLLNPFHIFWQKAEIGYTF